MNRALLQHYLSLYKSEFARINKMELYKWQAVKHFQEHWDIDSSDFRLMLGNAIAKTKNLLSSGNYYPRRMIQFAANHQPEAVRDAFALLYDEDHELQKRMEGFKEKISQIIATSHPKANPYQDDRAILVYLCLMYPEDYYLYKYQMFKDFCEKVEYDYKPKKGSFTNIQQYLYVCDLLRDIIQQDNELLKLHNGRIRDNEYFDKEHHILTQDVIYAITRHLTISESSPPPLQSTLTQMQITIRSGKRKINFSAGKPDYEARQRRNTAVGKAGELLVLEYEKANCSPKFRKKIKHISAEEGDGLGFNILSFDEHGNEKLIEVKTTTGSAKAPFIVTAHELKKSQEHAGNFYLYRLFNYDRKTHTADFFIIQGELSIYCENPREFHVTIDSIKEHTSAL